MVRRAPNPSLRDASCCKVEVVNGAEGLRRRGFSSTEITFNEPAASRSRRSRIVEATASAVTVNWLTFWPSSHTSFAVNSLNGSPPLRSASILQYSRGTNSAISFSRSHTSLSAGLCTRPADRPRFIFFHSSGERVYPSR